MMEKYEEIYCEVHGVIHEKDEDPYQYLPDPAQSEEQMYEDGHTCRPADWRRVWIGAPVTQEEVDNG